MHPEPSVAMKRLARHYRLTTIELIEKLIVDAEAQIIASLTDSSEEELAGYRNYSLLIDG